jgi:hypothetical protein
LPPQLADASPRNDADPARCHGERPHVRSARVAGVRRGRAFAEKKVLTLEIARKIVTAAEAEAVRNRLAGGRRQKFNIFPFDIYSF